jgi:DDE superfamily endonuclease
MARQSHQHQFFRQNGFGVLTGTTDPFPCELLLGQQNIVVNNNTMPRESRRAKVITCLESLLNERIKLRAVRNMDDDDESSTEDIKDLATAITLRNLMNQRYLDRPKTYRKSKANFERDLASLSTENGSNGSRERPWLSDEEFLIKYRMSRSSFQYVLDKIKTHPIFESKTKTMAPASHQLMVFLKYIGTEGAGSSNNNQRGTFGIGKGSADNYRQRVTLALKSLAKEYIKWPNKERRAVISEAIKRKFDFPHCVGIADGTLFPLAFEPQSEDAPDYSGRKYGYSLTTMIICDHTRRITHYLAGFPGSAHDNRVFKTTKLAKKPEQYFEPMQYLVGDSAFENHWFMVSAFKKPRERAIPRSHEKFNEKLARLRIISEHCIGMLKGRFPWLRSIRMVITDDPVTVSLILDLVEATIVLHNMLIEIGEAERRDWIDDDDCSDIDDAGRAPPLSPVDVINQGVNIGLAKDER